ncbi:IS701 family transposase [Chroococcidiopsis sp. CCNUC1]|uniref:IS701 family transposase n=1 Tax=Chroococcidiopsis sp. CCNUC1 TaxID=2653189 RepID=UPI002022317E|nr:IS701 family transposase [Chroococcidiopsis sp. CCNUC1]URD51276.1 IS701 family transposase [Chroococcidiopsis sp. CCNUC1]URD53692.1 IS701 family transposase [Chroococcidiopsis sp. CCNUC1]URD53856.1 IS701 family transposase [Chroococcidiopsis sp. CCNUC1]
MVERREPVSTVAFIDEYCQTYRNLFPDVRNFEAFKFLHLGVISEINRKSLPALARIVGLSDGQELHHFLRDTPWDVKGLRELRLQIIKASVGDEPIVLCIDETGDEKKGKATDYVAKQYIGNLGRTANGIVSVNAYAIVDNITYPLSFKIFKPRHRLKEGDVYKTKPQLAEEIIRELLAFGFKFHLVLADSLYGESGNVIGVLKELKLNFIVAIRSNHGVLIAPGQRVRYNSWRAYQQNLSHRQPERRYIREIIFGKRRTVRYYEITKSDTKNPKSDTWFIMTNLPGNIQLVVGNLYSLRNWIEYGFKQVKNELGWADFRLTDYASIERWWEIVFSAYLLISLQAEAFKDEAARSSLYLNSRLLELTEFKRHPYWESGTNWKSALNNLRLIIQPHIFWCLIEPWLRLFPIPGMKRSFFKLIKIMNGFRAVPIEYAVAS